MEGKEKLITYWKEVLVEMSESEPQIVLNEGEEKNFKLNSGKKLSKKDLSQILDYLKKLEYIDFEGIIGECKIYTLNSKGADIAFQIQKHEDLVGHNGTILFLTFVLALSAAVNIGMAIININKLENILLNSFIIVFFVLLIGMASIKIYK